MKDELRSCDLFPKVVSADTESLITIRPRFGHCRFDEDASCHLYDPSLEAQAAFHDAKIDPLICPGEEIHRCESGELCAEEGRLMVDHAMTVTAAVILIVSAFVHAGWNLIGKKASPVIGFFLSANFLGTLCLLPFVVAYHRVAILFSYRVWLLLLSTGFWQAVNCSGLPGAYRKGDMSLAYPMIRAFSWVGETG